MTTVLGLKQKEEVVISYNKLAMEQLQMESYDNALAYLKQALLGIKVIADEARKNRLMAITYNNLANYPEALKYLYKSVELENKLPNEISTIAGAHLNISAILAQQGDHSRGIRHGLRGVFLLKGAYKAQPKLVPTLVIAYYNVGNEYYQLGQPGDAEDCFKVGYRISLEELGPQHSLTHTLKASLSGISRKMSPNNAIFARPSQKNSLSPRERVPNISAKSRSTSQEHSQKFSSANFWTEKQRFKNVDVENSFKKTVPASDNPLARRKQFNIKRPGNNRSMSDEEQSIATERSFNSLSGPGRRIDLSRHKATERMAAVIIQSWWRGVRARRRFAEIKLNAKLKQAENKARKAVEEYEKLKQQAAKLPKRAK